ncbi:MAG TPA: 50S ribosomal protein L9 [Thermopetrobacter sp.]|nr:50S ribosomal protein L9 [Thermopetrobacter sp.]
MKVILLERVGKLGDLGDVVTVRDGYARNYLLPQGKALRANAANLERFEKEKAEIEKRNAEARAAAEADAAKADGQSVVLIRAAGEAGQLYGSATTRDIAAAISETFGVNVSRGQVALEKPIKVIGLHDVEVRLHPEVAITVTVNVARTEEEAELQAKGEILTDEARAEAEREQMLQELAGEEEAAEEQESESGDDAGADDAEEAAADAESTKDETPAQEDDK